MSRVARAVAEISLEFEMFPHPLRLSSHKQKAMQDPYDKSFISQIP